MKENASRQVELSSPTYSKNKRKLHNEQLETPFPKHVCRNKFAQGGESDPESTNSNSFQSSISADSFMSSGNEEDKTNGGFQETCTSEEASTSSDVSLYSSENTLSIKSHASELESLSLNQDHDFPNYQNTRHVAEFGSNGHVEIDCYTDKDLENLLYSNGVVSGSSYILSSGRWTDKQGTEPKQEGKKKMTIDKEFEQHFSMLMM